MKNQLPTLPSLPSITKQRPLRACQCGCGGTTQRTFVPGHDARLKAVLIRLVRGLMTLDQVAEWGGEGTRKAALLALKDRALLRRWNIEVPSMPVVNVPKVA